MKAALFPRRSRLWLSLALTGLASCTSADAEQGAAESAAEGGKVERTERADTVAGARLDSASSASPDAAAAGPEQMLPAPPANVPDEVDAASAVSTVVIDGAEAHFSVPISQRFRQGGAGQPDEFSFAFSARQKDGSEIYLRLSFDPNVADQSSFQYTLGDGTTLRLRDGINGKDGEWNALSGTLSLDIRSERARIEVAELVLQAADTQERKSIEAFTIEGPVERSCLAQRDASLAMDPEPDPQWTSEFCAKWK
jgi:hypothetical protein